MITSVSARWDTLVFGPGLRSSALSRKIGPPPVHKLSSFSQRGDDDDYNDGDGGDRDDDVDVCSSSNLVTV